MPAQPLLPGEDPDTDSTAVAYSWGAIYRDLVTVGETQLARLQSGDLDPPDPGAPSESSINARLQHLRARADFWRDRAWQLQGVDVDPELGELKYRGDTVGFSRREMQLLQVFLSRPKQVLSTADLVEQVWKDAAVTQGAVRAYVGRIRLKLADLALADISTEAGRGYVLTYRGTK